MAVFDTHKAYTAFKEAGFSDSQAQALIDQGREGSDALATKADLRDLEQRMTIRLGTMLFAVAGLQLVVIGLLLALFNAS